MKQLVFTLSFILSLAASQWTVAQTKYISDVLRVDLRTGGTSQHRIIAMLKSGTSVTVLEEPADSDWIKVVTEKGTEGWLRKQYLVASPIARVQLAGLQQEVSELSQQKQKQGESIQMLNNELAKFKSLYEKSESSKDNIKQDFDALQKISTNAVKLDQQNRLLIEEQESQKIEIEQLRQENLLLKNDQYIEGLFHGIVAVVLGAILAMVAPRINVGRKKSEW